MSQKEEAQDQQELLQKKIQVLNQTVRMQA